jgi:hypothetical protein
MTKHITVTWSYTIGVDVPENVGIEELNDITASDDVQKLASDIVQQASNNINWKHGEITDVQMV